MIIDTADNCTNQIVHLLADNVTTVIRYLTSSPGSFKLVSVAEAEALGKAGIRLGLVFENGGGSPGYNDINAACGESDASFCLTYVPRLGIPADGTVCIFFAIDNDMNTVQINQLVLPYFRAIRQVFAPLNNFLLGVYGSGAVCAACVAAGVVDRTWLSGSMGWTGSRAYLAAAPKELVLFQQVEDTRLANMDVDTDVAYGVLGDFLPFAPAPVVVVPPPVCAAAAEADPMSDCHCSGLRNSVAATDQGQSARDALDYAFKIQFGELFSGLFVALESAQQVPPSLMHRLLSVISMVPDVDINEAVARFEIGLDNLIIAYDRARAALDDKFQENQT